MSRRGVLVWAVGAAIAAVVAGGFALGLHIGNLHNGLIAVSFTAVGLYVSCRRAGNREGWLFVGVGAAHAVMFAGRQYGLHPARSRLLPGSAGSGSGRSRWCWCWSAWR